MSWEVVVVLGLFIFISIIYTMYDKHKGNKTLEQEIAELKEKSKKDLEEANKRKRLELLFGYRDNNIIFNLKSLTNYLEQKEIKCYLETLYPENVSGPHIKLTIEFKLTVYTVFIKVYDTTDTVKIEEVLRKLKD